MRAVVSVQPGMVKMTEVSEPSNDGVLIRVLQVGICGTDVKIFRGDIPVKHPRIMGHEMVGEVASASEGTLLAPGSRVLVDPGVACGMCDICREGRFNICRNGGLMGRDMDGVFAELVSVPPQRVIPVPAELSLEAAGLLQVLGTCVHAVKATRLVPGMVALVLGLGVAGQLIAQLLTLQGLTVIGVTRSEWKQRLAVQCGAAVAVAPDEAAAAAQELTSGTGPDLVVEAVGKESTLAQAIDVVKIGGEVLVFGTITSGEGGLPYYDLYLKELTIHNPRAALVGDYADGVRLAARGRLQLEFLVSHQLKLEEAVEAFRVVEGQSAMKVLMQV